MPGFVLRSEDFRHQLTTVSYPFSERSALELDDLYIGTDVFIDAILYPKDAPADIQLPLHISQVDGTVGSPAEAELTISSADGVVVGYCLLSSAEETHVVRSPRGVFIGSVTTYTPGLTRFLGRASGRVYTLLDGVAEFNLDVCHVIRTRKLMFVGTDTAVAMRNGIGAASVKIVARHGVQFTQDGPDIALNVLGTYEDETLTGVRSINGVSAPAIWLTNHPRANLRISTEDSLVFTAARDAT